MKIKQILPLLISMLLTQGAWAELSQLKDIKSKTSKDFFVTELVFDRPLVGKEYSVDFINETVQVNVPGARLVGKKRFQPYKGDIVRNLYTYQVDEDLLRHRIILKQGERADQFRKQVAFEKKANSLIVRIPKKSNGSTISSIIKDLPPKSKSVSAQEENQSKKIAERVFDEEEEEMKKLILAASQVTEVKPSPSKSDKAISKYQAKSKGKVEKKSAKVELDESKIPVLVERKEEKASSSPYTRVLFSFAIVGLLGMGAYLGLKKYKHQGLLKNSHTSIKMMTQHYLGPKKSLAIVSVAGESILIGITEQNISHIKTLSLLEEEVSEVTDPRFSDSLSREVVRQVSTEDPVAAKETEAVLGATENDEFSIKGIKDLVSTRLNGMRDL